MEQTFVYNSGISKENNSKTICLEFGLFFDGTLNNKTNTELRLKVLDQDDLKILPTDKIETVLWKEKRREKRRERFEKDSLDKNSDNIDKLDPIDIADYQRADKRSRIDKLGVDNSLMNDYTNIARMWKCCDEKYSIYIEGIGTLDKEKDVSAGFQYGSGKTGIREKVKKGCKELAKRIAEKKENFTKEIESIEISLDVFGFSRGAAAARNFLYEVNSLKKRRKDFEIKNVKGAFLDKDKKEVSPEFLSNGKMPKFGYLGYYLLEQGIKELHKINLRIRFLGVYDTVSSYQDIGELSDNNKKGRLMKTIIKGIRHSTISYFKNDVAQLQLNNLGKVEQIVHFVANDEHRENFALTTFSSEYLLSSYCLQKSFPGVHCDVGGAYETGTEYVDEIETSFLPFLKLTLNHYKEKLISDYWYKEEQLSISDETTKTAFGTKKNFPLFYKKLSGTRFLRKEYSYIPLHFMEEFFDKTLKEDINNKIVVIKGKGIISEYSIKNDPEDILRKAKDRLRTYVFRKEFDQGIPEEERERLEKERPEEEKEWTFISDEEIKKTFGEEKGIKIIEDDTLRKLRNKYLHWSANRDWLGMQPAPKRIRKVY